MLFPLLFCKQQCNFLEGECISLLTVSHLACYQISNPIQVWSWLEQAECIGEGLGETLLVDRFAGGGAPWVLQSSPLLPPVWLQL